jgi:hypothetical protein
MKRTKLFIGLFAASVLSAGFGPSLSSSVADVTLTYRLPTGQTVTITAPSCSVPAGGVLVSCSEIPTPPVQVPSTPLTPPQQEQPSQPSWPTTPTT